MKKKLLIVTLCCMVIATFSVYLSNNIQHIKQICHTSFSQVEALAKCEDEISKGEGGGLITVTVCDRDTPWINGIAQISQRCTLVKIDHKCSFNNL